ncbi:MAG: hypothetical protein H6600_05460 [Flavobacteriales bacterium]|nr:hypothetical protein [Flavobacteriales bacterium]
MIHYFTFNDQPSGIYKSQVLDTVGFLRNRLGVNIRLIAYIPISNFENNKKIILEEEPDAIVKKMIFGISRWKWHTQFLKFHLRNSEKVICRGPLAASLALRVGNQSVVYDGRAAVKAEVEEYDVTCGNFQLGIDFIEAEREAVTRSILRIAVSQKLVEYWHREFGYAGNEHVVIPCTLSESWISSDRDTKRNNSDVVKLVYSGGTGPWQSFDLVVRLLRDWLLRQLDGEVIFLTKSNDLINKLIEEFPERVTQKFVNPENVKQELNNCDFGLLIRDQNVTNEVSSPVKFAEYLSAGLKVLISDQIGDYSQITLQRDWGTVIKDELPILQKPSLIERNNIQELSNKIFSKDNFFDLYKKVIG